MFGEKRKEAEMERRRQGKKETAKEVKKQSGHEGEKEGNKKAGKVFQNWSTRVVLEKQEEGGERGSREAWK